MSDYTEVDLNIENEESLIRTDREDLAERYVHAIIDGARYADNMFNYLLNNIDNIDFNQLYDLLFHWPERSSNILIDELFQLVIQSPFNQFINFNKSTLPLPNREEIDSVSSTDRMIVDLTDGCNADDEHTSDSLPELESNSEKCNLSKLDSYQSNETDQMDIEQDEPYETDDI